MVQLMQQNSAIQLGRMQGELYQLQLQKYYNGKGDKPKYTVTPEHKLQRHLEREWYRERKKQK